jgi:hypothetical protein
VDPRDDDDLVMEMKMMMGTKSKLHDRSVNRGRHIAVITRPLRMWRMKDNNQMTGLPSKLSHPSS